MIKLCLCLCVCVCLYARVCACACVCVRACVCLCACACVCARVCVCMCVRVCACVRVCMFVCGPNSNFWTSWLIVLKCVLNVKLLDDIAALLFLNFLHPLLNGRRVNSQVGATPVALIFMLWGDKWEQILENIASFVKDSAVAECEITRVGPYRIF